MKRLFNLGLIPLLFGCATTQQSSIQDQTLPFTRAFQVHRSVLNNGLKLLILEDHSSPTFAYQTWYKVGSRNEAIKKTGLAHLFEHMMFKETTQLKEGEFDRLLEGAGAEGENAFTSRDFTAYIQEMPSARIDLITQLEASRMRQVIVNEKSFKTETEVVQNERRFRNENNPDGLMNQELFELAFQKHSYHWPIIGYQKDLELMSAHDALEFYHTYYSPNHATVIVVGDVNPNEVKRLVEKHYGAYPSQPEPLLKQALEPTQDQMRQKVLKLNIQVEKLVMGYKTPEFSHPDVPVLDVIQGLLTGGKSNRLRKALVETGISSGVESEDMDNIDPALFIIATNLQKGKKAIQARQVIERELSKLSQELVSDQELERTKNSINFQFYDGLGSNFTKAYFLGFYETISGDFRSGLERRDAIQKVSSEDILRVAKKYFKNSQLTVITGVPK